MQQFNNADFNIQRFKLLCCNNIINESKKVGKCCLKEQSLFKQFILKRDSIFERKYKFISNSYYTFCRNKTYMDCVNFLHSLLTFSFDELFPQFNILSFFNENECFKLFFAGKRHFYQQQVKGNATINLDEKNFQFCRPLIEDNKLLFKPKQLDSSYSEDEFVGMSYEIKENQARLSQNSAILSFLYRRFKMSSIKSTFDEICDQFKMVLSGLNYKEYDLFQIDFEVSPEINEFTDKIEYIHCKSKRKVKEDLSCSSRKVYNSIDCYYHCMDIMLSILFGYSNDFVPQFQELVQFYKSFDDISNINIEDILRYNQKPSSLTNLFNQCCLSINELENEDTNNSSNNNHQNIQDQQQCQQNKRKNVSFQNQGQKVIQLKHKLNLSNGDIYYIDLFETSSGDLFIVKNQYQQYFDNQLHVFHDACIFNQFQQCVNIKHRVKYQQQQYLQKQTELQKEVSNDCCELNKNDIKNENLNDNQNNNNNNNNQNRECNNQQIVNNNKGFEIQISHEDVSQEELCSLNPQIVEQVAIQSCKDQKESSNEQSMEERFNEYIDHVSSLKKQIPCFLPTNNNKQVIDNNIKPNDFYQYLTRPSLFHGYEIVRLIVDQDLNSIENYQHLRKVIQLKSGNIFERNSFRDDQIISDYKHIGRIDVELLRHDQSIPIQSLLHVYLDASECGLPIIHDIFFNKEDYHCQSIHPKENKFFNTMAKIISTSNDDSGNTSPLTMPLDQQNQQPHLRSQDQHYFNDIKSFFQMNQLVDVNLFRLIHIGERKMYLLTSIFSYFTTGIDLFEYFVQRMMFEFKLQNLCVSRHYNFRVLNHYKSDYKLFSWDLDTLFSLNNRSEAEATLKSSLKGLVASLMKMKQQRINQHHSLFEEILINDPSSQYISWHNIHDVPPTSEYSNDYCFEYDYIPFDIIFNEFSRFNLPQFPETFIVEIELERLI